MEQLHQSLTENGYDCGEDAHSVPVVFGPETEAEVKLFQAGHSDSTGRPLIVDGVVGPETWWALAHPSGGQQSGLVALPDMPVQAATNVVAAAALASAWEELRRGVREQPDGSNRGPEVDLYTGVTGEGDGPPWCAYFVSWNFKSARRLPFREGWGGAGHRDFLRQALHVLRDGYLGTLVRRPSCLLGRETSGSSTTAGDAATPCTWPPCWETHCGPWRGTAGTRCGRAGARSSRCGGS